MWWSSIWRMTNHWPDSVGPGVSSAEERERGEGGAAVPILVKQAKGSRFLGSRLFTIVIIALLVTFTWQRVQSLVAVAVVVSEASESPEDPGLVGVAQILMVPSSEPEA